MRKNSKFLVFLLLMSSIVIPIIPTSTASVQPAVDTIDRLVWSVMGAAGDWDPAISPGYFITVGQYGPNAIQLMFGADGNWGDVAKEIIAGSRPETDRWNSTSTYPVLALSRTVEYWPEENNTLGFINRGGVKSVTYNLRPNVLFHDGSAWNASVAKWNYDRLFIITSNASGSGDLRNKDNYWSKIKDVERYYSPSFNITARGYSPTTMGWYYDGITNWTAGDPTLNGSYPHIESVEILDNAATGGIVKVNYNLWNTYVQTINPPFISMEMYKNYYSKGIYGFTSTPHPDSPDITQHLVGTGPYIYQNDHDNTAGAGGTMVKNMNYWNRTALEADGWFDAEFIDILAWPVGLGDASRNTAMLGGVTTFGWDLFQWPLDYNSMVQESSLTYYTFPDPIDYMTSLTLNAINETWMSWGGAWDTRNPTNLPGAPGGNIDYAWIIDNTPTIGGKGDGTTIPSGLPRDLRKAMNYAYDYDAYLNTVLEGRGVRSGGLLGKSNIYYNSSVPIPDYNVTKAREILLNSVPDATPAFWQWNGVGFDGIGGTGTFTNFSQLCIDAGLDENSTDLDWATVASTTTGPAPLWVLDMYYDTAFTPLRNILITSLAQIGIAVTDDPSRFITTYIWDPVSHYYDGTFPVYSSDAWPLDWNVPDTIPEGWIEAEYFDPNRGSWRDNPWAPLDPAFDWFPWFNLHFAYDSDIDYWLDRMWMSNTSGKAPWISAIVDKFQNELYPMIYITQHQTGLVYQNDWEWSNYTGGLSFVRTRHVEEEEEPEVVPPLIFGYPSYVVVSISAIAIIGTIYIVMKKKKTFT